MKYTPRQYSYAAYLLRQIGFDQASDLEQYLQQLLRSRGRYLPVPKAKNPFKRWRYSAKACVEALMQELANKKNPQQLQPCTPLTGARFTPTQLAQYQFCSAAFAIANSFERLPTSAEPDPLAVGEQLHEQLRLSQQRVRRRQGVDAFFQRAWQNPAILKMMHSTEVYAGHGAHPRLFTNAQSGFCGSPDYIFQDQQGAYSVVEEKFIYFADPLNPSELTRQNEVWKGTAAEKDRERQAAWAKIPCFFYPNHQLQTLCYLFNLEDFPLSYAYLVYWLYDFKDGTPYVHKACVKKLDRSPAQQAFYAQQLSKFRSLIERQTEPFDPLKVRVQKCAACAYSSWCMHKTRRYTTLPYPYPSSMLRTFPAPFPEQLRYQI